MDLYRTFLNLLYLIVGHCLLWTPEMVTWILITVSICCRFVSGSKVGRMLRLSNWVSFYLSHCIVPGASSFVCLRVEVNVFCFFFLSQVKSREQLHGSSKLAQATAKQLPQDISSVANPPQWSSAAFAPPPSYTKKKKSLIKESREGKWNSPQSLFFFFLKILKTMLKCSIKRRKDRALYNENLGGDWKVYCCCYCLFLLFLRIHLFTSMQANKVVLSFSFPAIVPWSCTGGKKGKCFQLLNSCSGINKKVRN